MRPLYVDAAAPVRLNVEQGELVVSDKFTRSEIARFDVRNPKAQFDSLVIEGHAGYVSLAALNFLNACGLPTYFLDYDGSLLGSLVPNSSNANTERILWQVRASENQKTRLATAREILLLKLQFSSGTAAERLAIEHARTVQELVAVEQKTAQRRFTELFGRDFVRHTTIGRLAWKAKTRDNAMLNFGFALTESYARRLIIANGLSPNVGFVHQMRESFVYDLEEPLRWAAEEAVKDMLDERDFERGDFYKTHDLTVLFSARIKKALVERVAQKFAERQMNLNGRSVTFEFYLQRWLDALVRSWREGAV